MARNIVSDMPTPIEEAYREFHHAPILVVNVALRNWRFLDHLGISSGRWFEGFGNFFSIRRPMITGESTQPFDPDKPMVMTFYVGFTYPGYSIEEQGALGRAELLGKSYGQYETEIIEQMTKMFAAAGFDAERDVAGIVLNRWGHAYISPQPVFICRQWQRGAQRNREARVWPHSIRSLRAEWLYVSYQSTYRRSESGNSGHETNLNKTEI